MESLRLKGIKTRIESNIFRKKTEPHISWIYHKSLYFGFFYYFLNVTSMFNVNKTVQDVTQEIIDVMSFNEFPQILFVVKGYLEGLIEKIEAMESDVNSLQDLIELWHLD